MLFRRAILDRIAAGEVTLAFRRWTKPTVKAGTRLRTAVGVVEIGAVAEIADSQLTDDDASRAGYESRASLSADLPVGAGRALYRITLTFAGSDPRSALRVAVPDETELASLLERLAGMDASRPAPWTRATLETIAARPGAAAASLAEAIGRDKPAFKSDVRKLKELGLTESLPVGYRLSPRGERVLASLR